jgi:hypothetical protein
VHKNLPVVEEVMFKTEDQLQRIQPRPCVR